MKVWELDLTKWNLGRTDRFPVETVSLSPDGTLVAFTDTDGADGKKTGGRLLIARVGVGAESVRVFQSSTGGGPPRWSPNGDYIVTGGNLVRLQDGASCHAAGIFGFFATDHAIGRTPGRQDTSSTQFTTYDVGCHAIAHWGVHGAWNIGDILADRGLVLLNHAGMSVQVVRGEDGRVVRNAGRADSAGDLTWAVFADQGSALCGTAIRSPAQADDETNIRCSSTDNGALIRKVQAIGASMPIVASPRATRVVYTEAWSLPLPGVVAGLIPGLNLHPYEGAVVWDFATGEKVAAWRPAVQAYLIEAPRHMSIREVSKLALSQDGKSVAEAGNGRVIVYRIE